MSDKKVIIIGAGIAGLCVGSYLQMNGYNTEIFELHNTPGGLCTSWERGDYIFDGCIHSLGGTNPNYNLYKYWNELINMEDLEFKFWDVLGQFEEKGTIVKIHSDPEKLKNELLSIAPEDEKFIKLFPLIIQGATDKRNFVKKAVNWALRNIGKRNLNLNKAAVNTAKEIQQLDSKAARWIASDTIRELESEAVQRRIKR